MPRDLRTWDAWRKVHQPYELGWWKTNLAFGHSTDPEFSHHWAPVRQFIKPRGVVLDIGAGPRPPFAPCIVIDPLAIEYQLLNTVPIEWWEGVEVHAQPAEYPVPDLHADTVICWNCLDHTIGWKLILQNMLAYGRPGARFAVATDFFPPFDGHPGFERAEFESEIEKRFTVIDKREPFGRQLALLMKAKE
jgi:hypothetical protein